MQRLSSTLAAILLVSLATACRIGGGNGKDSGGSNSTTRGSLIGTPQATGSWSTSDLLALLPINDLGKELLQLSPSPVCGVKVWHIDYHTIGGQGEATQASAALMTPTGSDARCQGARPIVVYDHGTKTNTSFDIAKIDDQGNGEGLLMAAVFAANGYIVVAPNYAGYDKSTLGYHPYLNANQQSADTVDALSAARTALPSTGASAGSKLYLTGYSQGGFVSMATQRALEAQGTSVSAGAPMSGPYALAAFGDAIFLGQVSGGGVVNFTLLATSYQHSYGNIWSQPTDVFDARHAAHIEGALPSTSGVGTLQQQGVLPPALFSSTPPAPQYAAITPPTQPATLAPAFALGFGSDFLITNAYRAAYLQDQQAHPDGGFPTSGDGLPPASPGNTLRQALKTNDLRNWTPKAPLLLCAGDNDPTVFYLNTRLIQDYWSSHAPNAPVTVLDIDSAAGSGDPYGDYKNAFAVAKGLVQLNGGAKGVLEAYHATLVPPFCLAAVRAFFDAH